MDQASADSLARKARSWARAALIVWAIGVLPLLFLVMIALTEPQQRGSDVDYGYAVILALGSALVLFVSSTVGAGLALYARHIVRSRLANVALVVNGLSLAAVIAAAIATVIVL